MNILTQKNILIISPESWGKSYLSKHFYALELLKNNNRVWFLNSPYYKKNDFAREVELQNPGLTIIDDEVFRGLLKMPSFLQRTIIKKQIKKLESKSQVKWDVIWSFDNSRYFFLDCFEQASYRIHHVMDDHMDFQLMACCKSATLCLGVTPKIVERCRAHNKHSYFLQHGFAAFQLQQIILKHADDSINIVYIGNLLLKGFDHELIIELANTHKEARFHLIGSYTKGNLNAGVHEDPLFIQKLKELDNIELYGELPYNEAMTLASQADVLSIAYFEEGTNVADNSSKILPYLSTGKVVVSNYFEIYEGMHLLLMARSRSDYKTRIKETIDNLEEYNSSANQNLRMNYAIENSYQRHIEKIDELLANLQS